MDSDETKNLGFLTREEAAEALGVSTRQLHRYVTSGRIDFCLYRGRILFHEDRINITEGDASENSYFIDRMEELGRLQKRITLLKTRDQLYRELEANLNDDPLPFLEKISDIESEIKTEMLHDRCRLRAFAGLPPELSPEQQQQELERKRKQVLYITAGAEGLTEEQQQQIKQAEKDKQPYRVHFQASYDSRASAILKQEQEKRVEAARRNYSHQHVSTTDLDAQ